MKSLLFLANAVGLFLGTAIVVLGGGWLGWCARYGNEAPVWLGDADVEHDASGKPLTGLTLWAARIGEGVLSHPCAVCNRVRGWAQR